MKKPKAKDYLPHTPVSYEKNFEQPAEETEKWYFSLPPEPEEFPSCPIDTLNTLKQEANNYIVSDSNGYQIKAAKSSEQSWMRSVMAQGTGRDKLAAYTIMVQEKPIYNISALQSLINLVKPGKKESPNTIDTLVELFTTDLLPPGRKLKKFAQRPLMLLDELSSGNPAGRRRRLVLWHFEEQLKDLYQSFVEAVKVISTDSVEANKERAIKALGTLLAAHPEQEAVILATLVNKMGDPIKKIAAKSMQCLTTVLHKHPNMKGVIINEVEKLLFRSNVGHKARYYGVCFLSQILFTKADAVIAANIIKLYFSFFKACIKLGDVDSKMLGVLLSGVNRAYPYAREAMESISDQLDTLYKIVHIAPFHISLQGLTLLFQVSDYKNNVSDRFYSVLYRKLLDPALSQASHAPMFLNLTFQALKKDESIPRVKAFIKRLLQVCCYLPVPMTCATLYMISQLLVRDGLLAKSFSAYMKKEVELKVEPSEALAAALAEDDSEDEHYEDVPVDDAEAPKQAKGKKAAKSDQNGKEKSPADKAPADKTPADKAPAEKAWVHQKESQSKPDGYDPMHRNPLYANADQSCYSELCFLAHHFHPSVALFASQIANGEVNTYSGDPLKDFTLARFLERFSFKNPKQQPENVSSLFAKRKKYAASGVRSLPVRSATYLKLKEDNVPVEERYLFNYLQNRRTQAQDQDKDSDAESIDDDEFDDILDDIMKKKGFKKDMDEEEQFSDMEADLDFADDFTQTMTQKKSKKKSKKGDDDDDDEDGSGAEDEDEDDDDDFGNEDEDDNDFGDDEDDFVDDGGEDVILDGSDKGKKGKKPKKADKPSDKKQMYGGGDDDDDFDDEDMPSDLDFDDDDEDMEFGDESEDEGPKGKGKKHPKKRFDDVFASAEEFSDLIDAAASAGEGTSSAVSNKDKASVKQLAWEAKRDRYVKGFTQFTGKKGSGKPFKKGPGKPFKKGPGKGGKGGKPLGVKRPSFKPKKNGKR